MIHIRNSTSEFFEPLYSFLSAGDASMRSEVGTDLARQFKARMLAEQSAADSMLRKRILADEVRRES
jgi:hypothetical protein